MFNVKAKKKRHKIPFFTKLFHFFSLFFFILSLSDTLED
jgi:hypothetical protein